MTQSRGSFLGHSVVSPDESDGDALAELVLDRFRKATEEDAMKESAERDERDKARREYLLPLEKNKG